MNFYAVLGIPRDADEETIRNAYRILARRYHPDRGAGSSSEKFRQINEAYEALIDPGTRQSYDRSLPHATHPVYVRVEPMLSQSGPFLPEDTGVFGRFPSAPQSTRFRASADSDEFLENWVRSLDRLFFGSEWR